VQRAAQPVTDNMRVASSVSPDADAEQLQQPQCSDEAGVLFINHLPLPACPLRRRPFMGL
jgi:hypothetical protein